MSGIRALRLVPAAKALMLGAPGALLAGNPPPLYTMQSGFEGLEPLPVDLVDIVDFLDLNAALSGFGIACASAR